MEFKNGADPLEKKTGVRILAHRCSLNVRLPALLEWGR
jgi:hypothetical protein